MKGEDESPSVALTLMVSGLLGIFIVLFILLASSIAQGAALPSSEHLAIRPKTAKDEQTPFCLQATTISRILVYPDGRKQVVGMVTIYRAC